MYKYTVAHKLYMYIYKGIYSFIPQSIILELITENVLYYILISPLFTLFKFIFISFKNSLCCVLAIPLLIFSFQYTCHIPFISAVHYTFTKYVNICSYFYTSCAVYFSFYHNIQSVTELLISER